ncbi:MAG: SPOR domain-containing protein [Castellaniella sp.]|uniref:SPOR domain-containing protein n=1 Tax=Castellaniella sp. TaxID=1955812 RepID=UPI002A365DE1|nr:SPOR domain-containing protein [Castellaniella sp.]MDY0308222.1 SPOR domain-containing protein [Castellaniella sp.]
MFFRKGTETGQRAPARSTGTEAQLRELRVKARRRLIGALALVLTAFIIVPWLFDEPVPDDAHAPIVVPAPVAGLPPATDPPAMQPDASGGAAQDPVPSAPAVGASPAVPPAAPDQPPAPAIAAAPEPAPAEPAPAPPEPTREKPVADARKAADRPGTEKPAAARAPVERTDDGSVALALLAGKTPPAASSGSRAATGGRYYLQVAAYTTEQDAQARRDSLRQAGVTDAYVERGQSNGRTVYRLRVGPFGSHEAAQAAQARLRALGYQNGLISGK